MNYWRSWEQAMSESVAELDGERLTWMYRQMLRIREFEERVKATFTEHPGVIRGHTALIEAAGSADADVATSMQTTVYNVGIAAGSLLGGFILGRAGASALP
jgi:TPP-dependent pyruvate/acetoin dehydrogenase alpha subunit